MSDLAVDLALIVMGVVGVFFILISISFRLDRLERWHRKEHELEEPDVRKRGPR